MSYIRDSEKPSIMVFLGLFAALCIPFLNILIYLGNLVKSKQYYKDGKFTITGKEQSAGLISLMIGAAGLLYFFYNHTFFIPAVLTIAAAAYFIYYEFNFDKKVFDGRIQIGVEANTKLEALRDKL